MSDFSNLRRLRQAKAAEMLTGFTLQAWGASSSGDSSERKIVGNPGQAAANFVSECLADFDAHGQVRTKALATHREAGEGAHGISHGSIDVQVEIRPTHGMPVSIDIPVQVRQGYLLAPDVFFHNDVPYIIAQSSLDDVILPAQYRSPRLASLADRLQERIAKTIPLTKSDVDRIKQDQANRAREESEAAAKAKARRQQKQPGGIQVSANDGDWNDDYKGEHRAPGFDSGAPMHDLTGVYPDDFYGLNGLRYYGDGSDYDLASHNVIRAVKGKPNAKVKIYRAVPHKATVPEQIAAIVKAKAAYMRRGQVPTGEDPSGYYDRLCEKLEALQNTQQSPVPKLGLNAGDWVTQNREYAHDHGRSALNGEYKVLTKTVPAKHLFTDGNSLHEWGYDPSGVPKKAYGDWDNANAGDWGDEAETPTEDTWDENNAVDWRDTGDDVGDAACQFLHEHPGFDWSEGSMPTMYEYAQQHGFEVADFVDAANDAEHRMKREKSDNKAPTDHGVDNTSTYETDSNYDNFGQILPFAATARLKVTQSFNLDGNEIYSLPAGTVVQVLRELDTGVALIRTASAFEGYVETDDLV